MRATAEERIFDKEVDSGLLGYVYEVRGAKQMPQARTCGGW